MLQQPPTKAKRHKKAAAPPAPLPEPDFALDGYAALPAPNEVSIGALQGLQHFTVTAVSSRRPRQDPTVTVDTAAVGDNRPGQDSMVTVDTNIHRLAHPCSTTVPEMHPPT